MIRFVKYIILLAILVGLVVFMMANLDPVTVTLLPADLQELTGITWSISLPLYIVLFVAMVVGVIIGEVFEYIREAYIRREAAQRRQQVKTLKRDLAKVKREDPAASDEVLAILDKSKKA